MNIRVGVVLATLYVLSTMAVASDKNQREALERKIEEVSIVRTLEEISAPIRTRHELNEHLRIQSNTSPLSALSSRARESFLKKITFRDEDGVITSYSYEELEWELTATEAYKILALFGQQHIASLLTRLRVETLLDNEIISGNFPGAVSEYAPLGQPHRDYRCESRATCSYSPNRICLPSC